MHHLVGDALHVSKSHNPTHFQLRFLGFCLGKKMINGQNQALCHTKNETVLERLEQWRKDDFHVDQIFTSRV
jgi:hypothetical protein